MASFRALGAGPLQAQRRPCVTGPSRLLSVALPCPGHRRRCVPSAAAQDVPQLAESAQAGLESAMQRLSELYVVADATTSGAATAALAVATSGDADVTVQRAGGWVAPLADALEQVLYYLQEGLDTLHVPYSYGFSIILLTLIVKTLTFPLTKQQVESAMAVQSLKPRVDLIKERFGDDKDKISKETNVLYEQAGVNPLAGCLPTLATIPIFIGLYSSLTNVANDGLLDTQGFFWLPSLAGPTTMAQRQSGLGTSWLFPFVDGAPPIGWDDASAYLVLPALLLAVQYASTWATSPPIDPKDPNANTTRALYVLLPLMIGWFSLNVPSGLSLYYLSNTAISAMQQIYLKKLGGATVKINELGPVTKPGSGRRQGALAADHVAWKPATVMTTAEAAKARADAEAAAEKAAEEAQQRADDAAASGASYASMGSVDGAVPAAAAPLAATAAPLVDPSSVSRRCKRRRLSSLVQNGMLPPAAAPAAAGSSA